MLDRILNVVRYFTFSKTFFLMFYVFICLPASFVHSLDSQGHRLHGDAASQGRVPAVGHGRLDTDLESRAAGQGQGRRVIRASRVQDVIKRHSSQLRLNMVPDYPYSINHY